MFFRRIPMNIQFFAADGGDGGQGGQGGEGGQGSETPPSFDDLLKNPEYQAEFDRRMAKGQATAKVKWEKEQNMTAEQLAQQKLQEKESAIAIREAEITKRELKARALETFGSKGIPKEMADTLDYSSEDVMLASMKTVEAAFQKSLEKAVNDRLKGDPPKAGGGEATSEAAMRAAMGLPPKK